MTKLNKEIQDQLYDPEARNKAKEVLKYAIDKLFDPKTVYGKVEHGDMLMKDGLITQKTFGSESTGFKPGYPMSATKISSPAEVAQSIEYMEFYDREFGTVLHLDTKNRIVGTEIVSIGSLNAAVIHPREIYKKAVLSNSASIIFVHNHPSGDPTPSREDTAISEKLGEVGNIIGIPLMDSMIVGRGGKYYSYKEAGMLPTSGGLNKAFDPAPKRCEPSINAALKRKGIEPDTVDVRALIDSTLSCDDNSKLILRSLNARKTDKYQDAARKMAVYYQGTGKLRNASPSQRAAAFAAMREAGTLRGYDMSKQKAWEKELKKKASEGKKLRGQQTLTSAVSTSHRLSEYERKHDPKKSAVSKPTVKLVSGIPSTWYAAMVAGIKKRSDVRNPYAIVKNIWFRLSAATRQDIKRRAAKGEAFKYNLPLPEDLPTHGTGTLRMVKPFKLAEAQVNVSKKDMATVKKSGIFKPMKRQDGTVCQVARCKNEKGNVNIFVDSM